MKDGDFLVYLWKMVIPSGKHTKSYWKWQFIVSFPIKNGGSFHSFLYVYQSLPLLTSERAMKSAKATVPSNSSSRGRTRFSDRRLGRLDWQVTPDPRNCWPNLWKPGWCWWNTMEIKLKYLDFGWFRMISVISMIRGATSGWQIWHLCIEPDGAAFWRSPWEVARLQRPKWYDRRASEWFHALNTLGHHMALVL